MCFFLNAESTIGEKRFFGSIVKSILSQQQSLQDEQILDKFQVQVEAIVKEVEEMTINLWKSKDTDNLAVGEFLNGKAVIDRLVRNEELKHAETCFRKIF